MSRNATGEPVNTLILGRVQVPGCVHQLIAISTSSTPALLQCTYEAEVVYGWLRDRLAAGTWEELREMFHRAVVEVTR